MSNEMEAISKMLKTLMMYIQDEHGIHLGESDRYAYPKRMCASECVDEHKVDVWVDNREMEGIMAKRSGDGYELVGSHVGENVSTLVWRKKA
jgi:hypothetical protein